MIGGKPMTEWIKQLQKIANNYNFQIEDVPDILTEYILVDNETLDLHEDNKTLKQRNNEFGERIKNLERKNADIKRTIKAQMETERTHIGYNVLKQLYESLE